MKKFVIGVLVGVLLIGCLYGAGCGTYSSAEENTNAGELNIFRQSTNGQFATINIVDTVTGVQYVVIASETLAHSGQATIAICARYNADGTLYTGN
jgi:hypothetical protein